jgi:hypothetical protein
MSGNSLSIFILIFENGLWEIETKLSRKSYHIWYEYGMNRVLIVCYLGANWVQL